MPANQVAVLLQHVRRALGARLDPCTDGALLERFACHADEAAFAALMERHGPLVWNVSRRVARHEQDAEDVYQATFLLLARKAKAIRNRDSVGSWLYGVAYRLALRARGDAGRRRQHEARAGSRDGTATADDVTVRELHELLAAELAGLPEKYRAPLLLCYFDGLTQEEAARRLGWTKRSVKYRLERGRDRLRHRLTRRGVELSLVLAGSMLADGLARAAAPVALTEATLRATVSFSLRRAAGGTASAWAIALAEGGLNTVGIIKVVIAAAVLVTAVLAGTAGLLLNRAGDDAAAGPAPPGLAGNPVAVDQYGDPLPPGAVTRLGTVRFRFAAVASAFLPDGKTVVSVGQGAVQFWDPRTGRLLREIGTGHFTASGGAVGGFALSRDGKRLAVSGSVQGDGKPGWRSAAAVFDLATGKAIRTFERLPREGVNALTLSPDGKMLFTLDRNGKLRVEEVETGAELLRQQFPGDVLACLVISPDGSTLALGSGPNTQKIFAWRWQAAEEPRVMATGDYRGRDLAFSPDGKLLAECSDTDPDVRLLDVTSGRLLRRLELPDHEPYRHYHIAFSPDGKLLAAYGGTNDRFAVNLWDPTTGRFVKRLDISGALAFSPDGSLLVAGSRVWDFTAGKELSANGEAHLGVVEHLVTGDKDLIVTAGGDKFLRVWDAATGKQRRRIRLGGSANDAICALVLSADGTRLVSSSMRDDQVCLWDMATGKRIYRLPGHGKLGSTAETIIFLPDGKSFLEWGAADMYLREWDVRTGKALAEHLIRPAGLPIPNEDEEPFDQERRSMATSFGGARFTPDAKRLVLQANGKFFVFDTATGKQLHSFPGEGNFGTGMSISPDGRLVLTSTYGQSVQMTTPDGSIQSMLPNNHPVTLWDLGTGAVQRRVLLPEETPGPVAFSADGNLFAAASSQPGSRIRLFETATGREVQKIEGFRGVVRSLAFMPDGKRLVSGMEDSSALVWDLTRAR